MILWQIAKKSQKKYPEAKRKANYVFAGMLFCPDCKKRLYGANQTDYRKKNPKTRFVYRCTRYNHEKTCTNSYPIPETKIEKFLLNNVREMLENKIVTYKIEKEKAATSPAAKMQTQVLKIEKKLRKLKDLYLDDMIQRDEYELSYRKLEREHTEMKAKIEDMQSAEKHFDISVYEKFLEQDFEDLYHTLQPNDKRRLWLSVIDSIVAGRNEIAPKFF